MIRGVTFDKQLMTSSDFAHQTNYMYQGKVGITKGCTFSVNTDGDLVVADGYFMIYGRQISNTGDSVIAVPSVASGILYSRLVFTINLALENTDEDFKQGFFEILSSPTAYPVLIKENLDTGGKKYQLDFCTFQNTVSGITNLKDTRTTLSMSSVNADTVDGKHASDFAPAAHNHTAANITSGALPVEVKATNNVDYTASRLRNIQANTVDLSPGVSALANGAIYIVYE